MFLIENNFTLLMYIFKCNIFSKIIYFPLTQEDKEGFFLMGQLSKNGAQFFGGIQMTKLSVFRCLVRNTGVTN